jgi:Trk K+ transport system NAD-binding subunit
VALLYARALLYEFRISLALLAAFILAGAAILHWSSATHSDAGTALYGAWMAMLAQPIVNQPPADGHLMVLFAAYPVLGFILIGEGVVRLALLTVSRKYRQKEWTKLTASTYRDHVILCGLGHLGVRVLEQLVESGTSIVVLEKRRGNPMLVRARELKVPVLIRDMKEDQALIDAGVQHARAVVICTNDDMANLEVALDSRRLNPKVRIVMRLFEQQLAAKIAGALDVDAAFSSSSLAAPLVAGLSLQARVLSTALIGGVSHVTAEVTVDDGSRLAGRRVDELETGFGGRVLAVTSPAGPLQSPPSAATVVRGGDVVVFHTPATQLATVAAAARREG